MDKLLIQGGRPLQGEVAISGAKNAALPILCAALLTAEPLELDNVPDLRDIGTTLTLLQRMGVRAERGNENRVTLQADQVSSQEAPYELVKTMRASILVLGPLVSAAPGSACRAAAPSASGRWTSTSRAWPPWARASASSTASSWPRPNACAAPAS